MGLTYGFYNSVNHDRKYSAEQMAAIFDGLITEGVFATIGEGLMTVPGTGLEVLVKSGKAWFNHTWTINDGILNLPVEAADVANTRIDAVVLKVDKTGAVRQNSISVMKGTTSGAKPSFADTDEVFHHILAYVTVPARATSITAANIEVTVGSNLCPFVTGVLEGINIDDLFQTWQGEFDTFMDNLNQALSDDVVTNLYAKIDECVKKADKASSADITAGSSDTKWLSVKGGKEMMEKNPAIGTVFTGENKITDPKNFMGVMGNNNALNDTNKFNIFGLFSSVYTKNYSDGLDYTSRRLIDYGDFRLYNTIQQCVTFRSLVYGRYLYTTASHQSGSNGKGVTILIYDLLTAKYVKLIPGYNVSSVSGGLETGAFNFQILPDGNVIAASTMNSTGYYKVIDKNTFEVLETGSMSEYPDITQNVQQCLYGFLVDKTHRIRVQANSMELIRNASSQVGSNIGNITYPAGCVHVLKDGYLWMLLRRNRNAYFEKIKIDLTSGLSVTSSLFIGVNNSDSNDVDVLLFDQNYAYIFNFDTIYKVNYHTMQITSSQKLDGSFDYNVEGNRRCRDLSFIGKTHVYVYRNKNNFFKINKNDLSDYERITTIANMSVSDFVGKFKSAGDYQGYFDVRQPEMPEISNFSISKELDNGLILLRSGLLTSDLSKGIFPGANGGYLVPVIGINFEDDGPFLKYTMADEGSNTRIITYMFPFNNPTLLLDKTSALKSLTGEV